MNTADSVIDQQLGDYQIIELLGRGGMARVYKGYDARLDRYAAVKVIEAQLLASEAEEEYRQRFRREARAIASMQHPKIVSIYQFGEFGNLYYMAMTLIDGCDLGQILREHIQNRTRIGYGQAMRIAGDIAQALDYAHGQGVIHRDIKPSNIMVMRDGHAILTDFGLALSVPEGSTGTTFGSAHYIAPEQAMASNNAVPQSDLYSLCVVIYQMLAGKVPFDDPSAMSVVLHHLRSTPPSPASINPDLTAEIDRVLLKGLSKEPNQRFENGAAMIAALEKALKNSRIDLTYSDRPVARSLPRRETVVEPASRGRNSTVPLPADERSNDSTILEPLSRSDISRPSALKLTRGPGRYKRWLAAVGLMGILVLTGVFLGGISSMPPESASVVSAAAIATETPVAAAIATETPVAATASSTPSEVSFTTNDVAILTSHNVDGAATPTPAPTTESLPGNNVIDTTGDASLRLTFDTSLLSLTNISDRTLDLSGLEFVQELADGTTRSFNANQWSNADFSITQFRPGECVQIWVIAFAELPPSEDCANRQSWRSVSRPRWFWINSLTGDARFVVQRRDTIYAECDISDGECAIDMQG